MKSMKSSPKISSMNSDDPEMLSIELTIDEVKFLIDCMWGHSRHDTQALAFRHNISDAGLESRLSHIVADSVAKKTI